jgi:hypothetical protein
LQYLVIPKSLLCCTGFFIKKRGDGICLARNKNTECLTSRATGLFGEQDSAPQAEYYDIDFIIE